MKMFRYILPALIFAGFACEDVIQVDTPSEAPRLVVEGLLRVDTTRQFVPVEIRLTQTAGFFEAVQPAIGVESVIIIMQFFEDGESLGTGTRSLAETDPGSGVYVPDPSFDADQRITVESVVDYDVLFTLVITWQGRRYAAQTRYVPAVPIDALSQGDKTLFGDEETEIVVEYTDRPEEGNYYILDFGFGDFLPTEDTFYNGQPFRFSYFYDQEFEPGTALEIGLLGADQEFYNYMNLLVEQTGGFEDPFQSPVATVRGNIFDVTDIDNNENFDNTARPEDFALGFFAIVQEFRASITLE